MAYKSKAERATEETARRHIRDAVREIMMSETMHINTSFSSREMPSILGFIKDAARHCKEYRCTKVPGGVSVNCTDAYKITAERPITGNT
jgi:hypothetical protein